MENEIDPLVKKYSKYIPDKIKNNNVVSSLVKLANLKAKELNKYNQVRYSLDGKNIVTRVSYELVRIKLYFDENNFNSDYILLYLKILKEIIKKKNIEIYDYWPSESPNVTQDFINWIDEEINTLKLRVIQNPNKKENPFPLIFTGNDNRTFTLFETFVKRHIIDDYIDFSFIFQQMKFNGYITEIKHLKFAEWLKENNYITDEGYSRVKIEKSFRSLKKCSFGTRVDLYLKLQESIIFSDSDL